MMDWTPRSVSQGKPFLPSFALLGCLSQQQGKELAWRAAPTPDAELSRVPFAHWTCVWASGMPLLKMSCALCVACRGQTEGKHTPGPSMQILRTHETPGRPVCSQMTRLGSSHGAQIRLGDNRSPATLPSIICQSSVKEHKPPCGVTDHSSTGRRRAGPEPGFPENLSPDTCA